MDEPPRIRRAVEADCATVAAIDVRARRWAFRHFMPAAALDSLPLDERAPRWRAALAADGPRRVWIAEAGGVGLGFASWGPPGDADLPAGTASLDALYLVERAAGTGLAVRLAAAVLGEMRAEGYARAVLWVWTDNARARRFYERAGWCPDGATQVARQCGVELPALRYALRLA